MPKLSLPLAPATLHGLRDAFGYDPSVTLTSITTPTLALYGALDRRVDSADSYRHIRVDLSRGGARDVTVKMFHGAGHTLVVSDNGYHASAPERYAPGYPEIMLQWLNDRGFRLQRH
jgi:hypothetical protein